MIAIAMITFGILCQAYALVGIGDPRVLRLSSFLVGGVIFVSGVVRLVLILTGVIEPVIWWWE